MSIIERDEALGAWLRARSYLVDRAQSDSHGGLHLELSDGFVLRASADASEGSEWWRLLQPATELPHFVVGGEDCYTRS